MNINDKSSNSTNEFSNNGDEKQENDLSSDTKYCENSCNSQIKKLNESDISDGDTDISAKTPLNGDNHVPDKDETPAKNSSIARSVFDIVEMLSLVTVAIILCFSFVVRLNIVKGPSMEDTLHTGEYLLVSDLFYKPTPGDIAVIHDITAGGDYNEPLVKRIIATEGQTVDIDFNTWTLTVDGEVVDETSYIKLVDNLLRPKVDFPLTVAPGCVFVMGDNRNHSGDSRLTELESIDERCIVGKVYARIFPFGKMCIFKNPYQS